MQGPSPRVVKETKTIQTDPVPGISFEPDPNNYKHFYITLQGKIVITQDHQEPATKEVYSVPNFYYPTTTLCHHLKSFLRPKFIIPTSV